MEYDDDLDMQVRNSDPTNDHPSSQLANARICISAPEPNIDPVNECSYLSSAQATDLHCCNQVLTFKDCMQIAFGEMAKLNASDQTMIDGVYLLDVNPHYPYRQLPGDQNVIDARVTDTRSGVFLDITALSSVTPAMPNRVGLHPFT